MLFERVKPAGRLSPAVFPHGSVWIDGRPSSVRLPDGKLITIGLTIEVTYEAPPRVKGQLSACTGDPIYILDVVEAV